MPHCSLGHDDVGSLLSNIGQCLSLLFSLVICFGIVLIGSWVCVDADDIRISSKPDWILTSEELDKISKNEGFSKRRNPRTCPSSS